MRYQEKKYRVKAFDPILQVLKEGKAKRIRQGSSIHYYANLSGNDVIKLVSSGSTHEIHALKEVEGNFVSIQNLPMDDVDSGLRWLRDKGYETIQEIKMEHTDFEYKNGIVSLYIINGHLFTVILDFPISQYAEIESILGLEKAEIISIPYNKYLESIKS